MSVAIQIKSPALQWCIGSKAREQIERDGFHVDDIDLLVGASGGPKWLILEGLDRALFGTFLVNRSRPLPTLSSSIGSWRFACLGQADPMAALERFKEAYLAQSYPDKVTVQVVSKVLDEVLSHLLGDQGPTEILSHPFVRNNVVAIRGKGLLNSENKALLGAGLGATFFANLMNRHGIGWFCERGLFGDSREPALSFQDNIPTQQVPFSQQNMELVLRASAAVPLVLAGVPDIPGAKPGVYRDGGVTDYHFNAQAADQDQLVFYPHFYSYCAPGWFDKGLSRRHLGADNWPNLIMVSPSRSFIDNLPHRKIPDRKDFFTMENSERIRYWKRVVEESQRLGDEFMACIEAQRFA